MPRPIAFARSQIFIAHHPIERRAETALRIAAPVELAQRERPLGQHLEHQEARTTLATKLRNDREGRVGAIAGESRTAADADEVGHDAMVDAGRMMSKAADLRNPGTAGVSPALAAAKIKKEAGGTPAVPGSA